MKDQNTIIQESLMARIRELEHEIKVRDIATKELVFFIKNIDNPFAENVGYWKTYSRVDSKIRQLSDYVTEESYNLTEDYNLENTKIANDVEKYMVDSIAQHTDWKKSILNEFVFKIPELKPYDGELSKIGIIILYHVLKLSDNDFKNLSDDAQKAITEFLEKNRLYIGMTQKEIACYLNEIN